MIESDSHKRMFLSLLRLNIDSIGFTDMIGSVFNSLYLGLKYMTQYLQYAYSSRLRFKPDLEGAVAVHLIVTPEGKAKNVAITESTLNDPIMEWNLTT